MASKSKQQFLMAVVARYFKTEGWTYEQIGTALGVTRQRIQIMLRPNGETGGAGPCEKCGEPSESLHNHHLNYSSGEVVKLCLSCHSKEHGEKKPHPESEAVGAELGEFRSVVFLSNREMQVIRAYGSGLGTSQVADHLGVSIKTIDSQRASVLRKLSLAGVPALVRYAVRFGEFMARSDFELVPRTHLHPRFSISKKG